MCILRHISNSVSEEERLKRVGLRSADLSELMPFARQLANARENRDSHIGFVGQQDCGGHKVSSLWIGSTIRPYPTVAAA
jgi:hypothetical protein